MLEERAAAAAAAKTHGVFVRHLPEDGKVVPRDVLAAPVSPRESLLLCIFIRTCIHANVYVCPCVCVCVCVRERERERERREREREEREREERERERHHELVASRTRQGSHHVFLCA